VTIEFHCPHCRKLLKTSDEKAGWTASCPSCGDSIAIPDFTSEDIPFRDFHDNEHQTAAFEETYGRDPSRCPSCGAQVDAAEPPCPYCGKTFLTSSPTRESVSRQPHRGGFIVAMAILSWVMPCLFFLAFVAWAMGHHDLQEMEAGRMDSAGKELTRVGKIIGMVNAILCIGIVMLLFAMIALRLFVGAL